jgi:hypothetical protein
MKPTGLIWMAGYLSNLGYGLPRLYSSLSEKEDNQNLA